MYSSVVFSEFIGWCNHHHYLIPKYFHRPKKKPHTHQQFLPIRRPCHPATHAHIPGSDWYGSDWCNLGSVNHTSSLARRVIGERDRGRQLHAPFDFIGWSVELRSQPGGGLRNYISPISGLRRWDVLATARIPGEPSGTRATSKAALKENCTHQLVTMGILFFHHLGG